MVVAYGVYRARKVLTKAGCFLMSLGLHFLHYARSTNGIMNFESIASL